MVAQESRYPTYFYPPKVHGPSQSAPSQHRYQPVNSYSSSPIVYQYHVMGSKVLYGSPHLVPNHVVPVKPKYSAPAKPATEAPVEVKIEEPIVSAPVDVVIEPVEEIVESATETVVADDTTVVADPVVIEVEQVTDAAVETPTESPAVLLNDSPITESTDVALPVVEEVTVTTTAAPASSSSSAPLPAYAKNYPNSYRRSGPPRRVQPPSHYNHYRPRPSYGYPRPAPRPYKPYYPRY